jgi:hypothetical protein
VLYVQSIERKICHIQHPGGDNGQFLLSPPDVANGFFHRNFGILRQREIFLVILAFTSSAEFLLRVGGPQAQVLAIIYHWPLQDAIYILRLKMVKNFQVNGNPEFSKAS